MQKDGDIRQEYPVDASMTELTESADIDPGNCVA